MQKEFFLSCYKHFFLPGMCITNTSFNTVLLSELPTICKFNPYQNKTDEWLPYFKTTIF